MTTRPHLAVWFDSMPESNGKRNWTVILHRADEGPFEPSAFQVHRGEFYDRARYDRDCLRYTIGELEIEPCILDYDANLKEPRNGTIDKASPN